MNILTNINFFMWIVDVFTGVYNSIPFVSVSVVEVTSPVIIKYEFSSEQIEWSNALARNRFPKNFNFGVSTSAYQIEGAWNVSGKGESVWDHMTHTNPALIADRSNADVAADSYHKYKEDIRLAKSIGSTMYKISISWPRILPNGYDNYINPDGIEYYSNLINETIAHGIEPMVTLVHWDLPYPLQVIGGWTNPLISELFGAYARVAFAAFGDRVKYWVTMNEPTVMCNQAYGGATMIPGLNQSGLADYLCGHHVLLAHANAYDLYDEEFRSVQNGKVGIVHHCKWFEPQNKTSTEDFEAAERGYQWYNEWFLHPIFSETGDYPVVMKNEVMTNSYLEGSGFTRLPFFTMNEILRIQGSADFLGISYNSATTVSADNVEWNTSFDNDAQIRTGTTDNKLEKAKHQNKPWAFYRMLNRLSNDYVLPEIFITENGYIDNGDSVDVNRVIYFHHHISVVLKAMQEGVSVRGYLARSLIDGFEWQYGYKHKTGVFNVDFGSRNRTRTPKLSSQLLSRIYKERVMPQLNNFLNVTAMSL